MVLASVALPPVLLIAVFLVGFVVGRLVFGPRVPTQVLLRCAELATWDHDSATALHALSVLARRRPRDGELHAERAWHLARVGRPRDAAKAYRRAVRLGQRDGETLLGLAQALEAVGERDAARAALAQAIEADPTITEDDA